MTELMEYNSHAVHFPRRLCGLRAARLALFLTACFALSHTAGLAPAVARGAAGTDPAATNDVRELAAGEAAARELSDSARHVYSIRLRAGDYLRALVEKSDLYLSATLYGPDGQPLRRFTGRRHGPLNFSLLVETGGDYRVEIRSLEEGDGPRRYAIRLEAVRAASPRDREDAAALSLFTEAESLRERWEEGALREAARRYEEAASRWLRAARPLAAAGAFGNVGDIHLTLSEYPQALAAYEQELRWSRAVGDRLAEARAINHIGYVHVNLGQLEEAIGHFRRALGRSTRAGAAADGAEARLVELQSLNNLGEVYYAQGELWKSLKHFDDAFARLAAMPERRMRALISLNVGYVHLDSGDTRKALEHFEQALSLWHETGDRRGEAQTRTAIGTVLSFLGEKQRALDSHKEALNIFRVIGDRQGEAVALNSIGKAYEDLNEPRTALDSYTHALEIYQASKHRDFEAVTRYYIGRVYKALGETQRALDYFNESISLCRRIGQRRVEAYALAAVGAIYGSLDRPREARRLAEQVLALYRELGDRWGQANALNSIGDLHHSSGEKHKALALYRQAHALTRAAGDRGGEAETLYKMATAARDSGDLEGALSHVGDSIDIVEALRVRVASKDLRASYFSSVHKHYGLYISLLMQMHRRHPARGYDVAAFQASESARARSLLETLTESNADIRRGVDPALLERERALQQLLNSKAVSRMNLLNAKRGGGDAGPLDKEIRQLTAEYQEVQAQIRERSPRYATLVQPSALRLEDIQDELRDGRTLLLEYALGDERSYLWAVTPTSVTSYELPGRAKVEEAARQVYALLTARQTLNEGSYADYEERVAVSDQQYWQQAAVLSQMLLGPVASQLGTQRLLVVADGALQYIPFEALPRPVDDQTPPGAEPPAPLVLGNEVVNLPSASALAILQRETPQHGTADKLVAVLADPVFESDDPRVKPGGADRAGAERPRVQTWRGILRGGGAEGGGIPRLPATLREAKAIMSVTPGGLGFVATDFLASRATVMDDELSRYSIVHFATHGIVDNDHPEMSGIILSMVDEQGRPAPGFLQLHDIYNLKLSAGLVVLSACNTGLGKNVRGEGLVGLTRGFMYSGSKSVLASLWKVDDQATAELMGHFYRAMLQDGLPPATALKKAKEAMWRQKRWRSPFFWAGFVLHGEYRESIRSGGGSRGGVTVAVILMAVLALAGTCYAAARARPGRRRA